MKKVSFVVVGAGGRGGAYSGYVKRFPEEGFLAAVCEPDEGRRKRLADAHEVPQNMRFADWRDILDKPKLADAAFICTQDADHKDPAVELAAKGYHILLEKPMAPNPEDCRAIYEAATKAEVMLAVCHVLRYTWFNRKLKEIIDSGAIGGIQTIQLLEPVGYWHQAHSFVRGNWRNSAESSPMLLAKSCHDIDLLNYFMPSRCVRASSFGSLSYFRRENQPKGAADRCMDCPQEIESLCAYSALKIYLRDRKDQYANWPTVALTHEGTLEAVIKALKEGPYGRCVFACDNDVVDHQVVNLEFEDGATASFTMTAFNPGGGRETLIMGDQGMLRCTDHGITHHDFLTNTTKDIQRDADGSPMSGHGGGDFGLMQSFLAAVRNNDPALISSGPEVSLQSHLIVFAAEKARREGTVESPE
jgi:predicted dehydrogenase